MGQKVIVRRLDHVFKTIDFFFFYCKYFGFVCLLCLKFYTLFTIGHFILCTQIHCIFLGYCLLEPVLASID